jgi:hypothetical protein
VEVEVAEAAEAVVVAIDMGNIMSEMLQLLRWCLPNCESGTTSCHLHTATGMASPSKGQEALCVVGTAALC